MFVQTLTSLCLDETKQSFDVYRRLWYFYAPEGWHIVIDSSVSQSLFCPEHNFKTMQGINIKHHR